MTFVLIGCLISLMVSHIDFFCVLELRFTFSFPCQVNSAEMVGSVEWAAGAGDPATCAGVVGGQQRVFVAVRRMCSWCLTAGAS